MSKQFKEKEDKCASKKDYKRKQSSRGKSKPQKSRPKDDDRKQERMSETIPGTIPLKNGDRNPNWYFTDAKMADQVTQLAFQNLAGYPVKVDNVNFDVPNVIGIFMNPSPGVIKSADFNSTLLNKMNGVNLAGFRFYSELSAYTGRTSTYAPQDISTMVLALGEVLSTMEFIRRAFGVAFTMNMRNRSYPRTILEEMRIDPDDLFTNFSDYRTRFNTLITMVNQLPIPSSIAYFEKCMRLYQEMYLDTNSAMAQTLIPCPFSTWVLDETSYSGGTILKTVPMCAEAAMTAVDANVKQLSYYLNVADQLIGALLNSSTLNIVYTDILNYAAKKSMNFIKLDYLAEGYAVLPRFSIEFLLQMHNATITGIPAVSSLQTNPHITPMNDVYPNPNINSLYYNPGFWTVDSTTTGMSRTGVEVIVDMMNDAPDVNDRVEFSRFTSICGHNRFNSGASGYLYDSTLPDHYVCNVHFWTPSGGLSGYRIGTTNVLATQYTGVASLTSNIDWAPHFYELDAGATGYSGKSCGDLNYYTVINEDWLRKVNQFIALGLYVLR